MSTEVMSSAEISNMYQMKTDIGHILDAPDTYIGSVVEDNVMGWIISHGDQRMKIRNAKLVPGLCQCLDEILVNCGDQFTRVNVKIEKLQSLDKPHQHRKVTSIEVSINKANGMISVMNDGDGIDVVKHPEHDMWIPEMIFAHLRTSTNYKKDEIKIVGGKNGFGVKLVFIYSKWAKIETVDHFRGLKYVQEFRNNLSVIEKPKITKFKGKPYTKVSWIPDYPRFGLAGLSTDMESIFYKRCIDISAITGKTVKVKYNNELIQTKTFEQYIDLFVGKKDESKRVYEKANDRWEYAVCLTPTDEFTQVSFVNGINTNRGGKHVEYILNQITRKVVELIEKKKKVKVKPVTIKEQLMLFVNCVIENPSFDSQTKDTLNTSSASFGSTCKVSDKFIEKICKLGIVDQALSIHQVKVVKQTKKTDGKKTKTLYGIPKLIDANYAGTAKSKDCTLILCEGDSAKAGIVSGMTKEDRNFMGVYPLKGKLMNVRDMTKSRVGENKEITEIKKIMGLVTNKEYKTREEIDTQLRYGKIVLLTDQDLDGIHIKGLCVNMFDSEWNSLIRDNTFLGFMNTPILKAKKGKHEKVFYNEKEYQEWKDSENPKGWTIKYYKGLGTSTSKEFKEYLKDKRIVHFQFDDTSTDALDKVFRKNRADDRKTWLENYSKDVSVDTKQLTMSYKDFVDRELIHFSKYDCERSIPNLMDGLKTSQRKILYCAFKRKLQKEIKVAQFGGYVSEHSGYHHGETSLMQAIVGMAQDFVGSNNINLFMPNGQFGTRLQGGTDSASERYIFTQLNSITRSIFPELDDSILHYLDDDGDKVEPEFYLPILPMILVNGALGIGTGFSTYIPTYNPKDILQRIKTVLTTDDYDCLNVEKSDRLVPWTRDFKGSIELHKDDPKTVIYKGVYTIESLEKGIVHITELPVGTWTEQYKLMLEKLMDGGSVSSSTSGSSSSSSKESPKNAKSSTSKSKIKVKAYIKDYQDQSTDKHVDIRITFVKGVLNDLVNKKADHGCSQLEKVLHLYTTKKTSNMHIFDDQQKLHKYENPEDIIKYFIPIRKTYYEKRKNAQLNILERQSKLLLNKAKFIKEQCEGIIDLRRKKKDEVIALLKNREYDLIDDEEYRYLRQMPIDSFIEENIDKLEKERDECLKRRDELNGKTINQLWLEDIDVLEKSL